MQMRVYIRCGAKSEESKEIGKKGCRAHMLRKNESRHFHIVGISVNIHVERPLLCFFTLFVYFDLLHKYFACGSHENGIFRIILWYSLNIKLKRTKSTNLQLRNATIKQYSTKSTTRHIGSVCWRVRCNDLCMTPHLLIDINILVRMSCLARHKCHIPSIKWRKETPKNSRRPTNQRPDALFWSVFFRIRMALSCFVAAINISTHYFLCRFVAFMSCFGFIVGYFYEAEPGNAF